MPTVIFAQAEAEEVADGRFDTGAGLAIPVDTQDDPLQMVGLAVGDSEPDVGDLAGAIGVQHRLCGAGSDAPGVCVCACWIGTRCAVQDVSLLDREVRLPVGSLRMSTKGQC